MTETSTVTTTSTVADHKLGTVGRAIPGSEIKIADDGEILARGPHIFGGYYGIGDTTAFGEVDATAGCTPATSARWTTRATSPSPAARRTS